MNNETVKVDKFTLEGRLTIGDVQKKYEQIMEYFKGNNNLEIFLPETSEIDLTFLQILYSLLATAHKSGKNISVLTKNSDVLWSVIVNAGFETHFSINIDPESEIFQIEGNFNE